MLAFPWQASQLSKANEQRTNPVSFDQTPKIRLGKREGSAVREDKNRLHDILATRQHPEDLLTGYPFAQKSYCGWTRTCPLQSFTQWWLLKATMSIRSPDSQTNLRRQQLPDSPHPQQSHSKQIEIGSALLNDEKTGTTCFPSDVYPWQTKMFTTLRVRRTSSCARSRCFRTRSQHANMNARMTDLDDDQGKSAARPI